MFQIWSNEGALASVLAKVGLILKDQIHHGNTSFSIIQTASLPPKVLDQILVTIHLLTLCLHAIVFIGHIMGLFEDVPDILTLVKIISDTVNTLIAADLVFEQILARKAMTELIRVWSLIEYHFHDWTHQKTIVTATAHHVRTLCQLLKFMLQKLIGGDRGIYFFFFTSCLTVQEAIVRIGVVRGILAHLMKLSRRFFICEGL